MLRRLMSVLLLIVATPLAAAEPVALVTELAGTAQVTAGARPVALDLLHDLAPGARVSLAAGARATVVHTATGVVYELHGPGAFRVQPKGIDAADARARLARRELPAAFRTYRLDPAVAAQASLVLRDGGDLRLDGPDGGVLAESELRYRVVGVGQTSLRETRFDVLDAADTVVLQVDDGGVLLDLAGRHAWVPGQRYRVRVTGLDRNGRTLQLHAQFVLLPGSESERVAALRPRSAGGPPTDWIVYALALESIGANATARPIWRSIAASR